MLCPVALFASFLHSQLQTFYNTHTYTRSYTHSYTRQQDQLIMIHVPHVAAGAVSMYISFESRGCFLSSRSNGANPCFHTFFYSSWWVAQPTFRCTRLWPTLWSCLAWCHEQGIWNEEQSKPSFFWLLRRYLKPNNDYLIACITPLSRTRAAMAGWRSNRPRSRWHHYWAKSFSWTWAR